MRSLLFVPGDDERKIAKGLASTADALILDLEDSVAAVRKGAAREICAHTLRNGSGSGGSGKTLFVRINALETSDALLDLAAVVGAKPFGIVLPKCRGAADVRQLGDYLSALEAREAMGVGRTRILPIATETGASMFGLGSYAEVRSPRLFGLFWGGEDLAADLGAASNRDAGGDYTPAYTLARSLLLYAASAASVVAVDSVYTDFRDEAGLDREAAAGLRDGFSAKAAIHPAQVDVINAAFTPSAADIEWAQRVVALFEGSAQTGVAALDGRMLDRPHYRSAQRVLARAGASSSH